MKFGEILAKFEILVKFGGNLEEGKASKTRINLFRNIFKNYQSLSYSVTQSVTRGLIVAAESQLKTAFNEFIFLFLIIMEFQLIKVPIDSFYLYIIYIAVNSWGTKESSVK